MIEKTFAKVDKKNIVKNIEIATDEWIKKFNSANNDFYYIEVTENTRYPSINGTYDLQIKKFIDLKPYNSWTLDDKGEWIPPIPRPKTNEDFFWNEENKNWQKFLL